MASAPRFQNRILESSVTTQRPSGEASTRRHANRSSWSAISFDSKTSHQAGTRSFPITTPHWPTRPSSPTLSTRCRCAVPSLSLLHPSLRPFPPSAFRGIAHNDHQGALAIGDEFAHDIVGPGVVAHEALNGFPSTP